MTYHGGKFYITDLGRDLIIILESEGQGVKVFGGSGTGPGQFWDPAGLAVDDLGNFIVADSRNHRLQLIGQDRKWIRNVKVIILILSPLSRVICPTKLKIGGRSNPFGGSSITYVGSVCHLSRVIWSWGAHSALTS